MRIVTLIGLIGSGKSSFRALMEEKGHPCLDLDSACLDLYKESSLAQELSKHFGCEIYKDDALSSINKTMLAHRIFNNLEDLRALEGIIYPRLEVFINEWIAAQKGLGHELCLIECSVYKGEDSSLAIPHEWLVALSASSAIRKQRLIKKGLESRDIEARMNNQLNDSQIEALAHEVISNEGSLEDLRSQFNLWYLKHFL